MSIEGEDGWWAQIFADELRDQRIPDLHSFESAKVPISRVEDGVTFDSQRREMGIHDDVAGELSGAV